MPTHHSSFMPLQVRTTQALLKAKNNPLKRKVADAKTVRTLCSEPHASYAHMDASFSLKDACAMI